MYRGSIRLKRCSSSSDELSAMSKSKAGNTNRRLGKIHTYLSALEDLAQFCLANEYDGGICAGESLLAIASTGKSRVRQG